MLKRTTVRFLVAMIAIFIAMHAEGRVLPGPSCDELGELIVCNEATCVQTDEYAMQAACWWEAQNTAILTEEWEWYEQNCLLDYECKAGVGSGCEPPLTTSHVECEWHH